MFCGVGTGILFFSYVFAEYTVFQLQSGWVYFGPSGIDNANLCECSTVGYSLYSACGACQVDQWVTCDHIVFTF